MKKALALVFCLALSSAAFAQDPDLVLSVMAPADAQGGTSFDASVVFDNTSANDCDGWSYGTCHDGALLTLNSWADSALVSTINGGGAPGFGSTTLVAGDMGGTQGIVIDLFGINKLAPGTGYALIDANYTAAGVMVETLTQVDICGTLGNPPVADVIVIAGASITPTENSASINITLAPPAYTLRVTAAASVGDGGSFDANVEFDNVGTIPIDGWSYGVCHDGGALSLNSFADSALVATINGGAAPGFGSTSLVDPAMGGTQGIVIDLFGINKLDPGLGFIFVDMNYTANAGLAEGDPSVTTQIDICGTLGNPPVADVIVEAGASIQPQEESATVQIDAPVAAFIFIRGECNGDNTYNIADGIWTLNMLFQGGPPSSCPDACDANDDGVVDSADAMYTFFYRLMDGPPPPAPWPDCGTDPTDPTDPMTATCDFSGCP